MAASSTAGQMQGGSGGQSCVVAVQGYTRFRDGKLEEVSAYERSNPDCNGADTAGGVVPVMARRRDPFDDARGKSLLEGGGGVRGGGAPLRSGAPLPKAPGPSQPTPPAGSGAPRQSLLDILAPGGQPIGRVEGGARPTVRTLDGGDDAARAMFDRLTRDRGGIDVTPPGRAGRSIKLPDGSFIGYRPNVDERSPSGRHQHPGP